MVEVSFNNLHYCQLMKILLKTNAFTLTGIMWDLRKKVLNNKVCRELYKWISSLAYQKLFPKYQTVIGTMLYGIHIYLSKCKTL